MRVGELMLPLAESLVAPTATLAETYVRLLDHQRTCLVLDERPLGRIVRMRRILEQVAGAVLHGQRPDPERSIATISEPVETVPWDLPAELAAKRLFRRPSRALLVADAHGEAVGLLGWPQLNQFFDEMLDVDSAIRLELSLPDHPGALAAVLEAIGRAGANVRASYLSHARDGTRIAAVYLSGGNADAVAADLRRLGVRIVDPS